MENNKHPLQAYYNAARQEKSPLTSDEVASMLPDDVVSHNRKIAVIPLVVSGAVAALATAGIVYMNEPSNTSNTEPIAQHPAIHNQARITPKDDNVNSMVADPGSNIEMTTDNTDTPVNLDTVIDGKRIRVMTTYRTSKDENPSNLEMSDGQDADAFVSNDSHQDRFFIAISADEQILDGLDIQKGVLPELNRVLSNSDSLVVCNTGNSVSVNVCSYKNGKVHSMNFGGGKSLPIMITTSDGKGQVIRMNTTRTFDPNELVPVRAGGDKENMLMWYQPNEDFINAFPDSLQFEFKQLFQESKMMWEDSKVMLEDAKVMKFDLNEMLGNMKDMKIDLEELGRQLGQNDSVLKILKDIKVPVSPDAPDAPEAPDAPDAPKWNGGNGAKIIINKTNQIFIRSTDDSSSSVNVDIDVDADERDAMSINVDSLVKSAMSSAHMELQQLNTRDGISIDIDTMSRSTSVIINHIPANRDITADGKKLNTRISSRIVIIHNGKTQKTPATTDVPVRKLQELGRSASGAINATNVYPNPTSDGGATISFELTEPRMISLSLTDLSGNKVADLASNVAKDAGKNQVAFTLGNVSPGMYLLAMTTDKDERIVQRFIVNK